MKGPSGRGGAAQRLRGSEADLSPRDVRLQASPPRNTLRVVATLGKNVGAGRAAAPGIAAHDVVRIARERFDLQAGPNTAEG